MRGLLLKLEPLIWVLFGAGMLAGGLLLPALILGLGFGPAGALGFEHMHALAASGPGRIVLLAATALPLWAGAHHLRHLWIDFGGLRTDGLVGGLLYGIALLGSVLAVVAVVRL